MLAIIYIVEGYLTIISLPSAKGLQGEASSSTSYIHTFKHKYQMNQKTNLDIKLMSIIVGIDSIILEQSHSHNFYIKIKTL